jgi:hypothetical protein
MTSEQVQGVIDKYVDKASAASPIKLWVCLAKPGQALTIPGMTFGMTKDPNTVAGMHYHVNAYVICLRDDLAPESLLTTFFHEYGHATYEKDHRVTADVIESEMAAILTSLQLCLDEGLEPLAYREADAIKKITATDPYKTAVERLAANLLWRKYARLDG